MAFLSPESDGLSETWIDNELNGSCKLDFQLPLISDKWQYLTNQYRIYAGGKEFVISNPDAITKERDGKKKWGKVSCHESWVLLGKDYAEAGISNDPQRSNPPALAVAIISGGSDLSGGRYSVGSAGHALSALLQGTGWTVGTVDVGGIFDLETEKESILANINKVQELWGGYLVWDSINKIVSLRSESLLQNYTGFSASYAKNLKGISRIDDCNITTKLYPFGENDLNISTVNDGILYLTNNSYSSEELTDIWSNQDLKTPQALKDGAIKYLAKVCKPRHKYSIEIVDLRTIKGYEHETFDIGHLIDVTDEELGINDRARIIRYKYNVFQPWQVEIDVGDPIEKIATSIANSIKAAEFVKKSIKPNTSFQNLLKAMLDTAATEINGASGDYTLVDGVSTWAERDGQGNLTGKLMRATPAGLIISSDGGQTWDLAISGSGINASVVNTGKLNAGVVQIGVNTTFEEGYDPLNKFETPGYVLSTEEGIKVFDNNNILRVLLGSWLKNAVRKYGIKIINGEIYSTSFKSGNEGDTDYVIINSGWSPIEVVKNSKTALNIWADDTLGGMLQFYDIIADDMRGQILPFNDAVGKGLRIQGRNNSGYDMPLDIIGSAIHLAADQISLEDKHHGNNTDCTVWGSFSVTGDLSCGGAKPAQQATEDYGLRYMYATEAPELIYYDRGAANLVGGEATVYLDPIYLECIEPDAELTPWQIWVQCYGENDVYVSEIGEDYFKIKERNNGTSNNKVIWKHEAIRNGYAGIRLMEVLEK